MKKKQPRTEILWVRISKENESWIKRAMKRTGYKSKSEFIDAYLDNERSLEANCAKLAAKLEKAVNDCKPD
jgi:Arc/MetJ-type ribon-helix-helix transcriptional regulator